MKSPVRSFGIGALCMAVVTTSALPEIKHRQSSPTPAGSGPYPATYYTEIPGLAAGHTLYAPASPPTNKKLPIVVWGNGGCLSVAAIYYVGFLTELASQGVIVLAAGTPNPFTAGTESQKTMQESLDWAFAGGAGGRYGTPDLTKVAAAGHSCGGLEALTQTWSDSRITLTLGFGTGLLDESQTPQLKMIKTPVAYFIGGPSDVAYNNGARDFGNLQGPGVLANLDVGHLGTFSDANGGKYGDAAVRFLKWQWEQDAGAKGAFVNNSTGPLVAAGWSIQTKNIS